MILGICPKCYRDIEFEEFQEAEIICKCGTVLLANHDCPNDEETGNCSCCNYLTER